MKVKVNVKGIDKALLLVALYRCACFKSETLQDQRLLNQLFKRDEQMLARARQFLQTHHATVVNEINLGDGARLLGVELSGDWLEVDCFEKFHGEGLVSKLVDILLEKQKPSMRYQFWQDLGDFYDEGTIAYMSAQFLSNL